MQGLLSEMTLREVLQLLTFSGLFEGLVTITLSDGRSGNIAVRGRDLVAAQLGEERGMYALIHLLQAKEGSFATQPEALTNVDRNVQNLSIGRLIEHQRLRDELWPLLEVRVQTVDHAPVPNWTSTAAPQLPAHHRYWKVLLAIDAEGKRSIREIARVTELDEISVCQVVCELQDLGILQMELQATGDSLFRRLDEIVVKERPRGFSLMGRPLPTEGSARAIMQNLKGKKTLAELHAASNLDRQSFLTAVRRLISDNFLEIVSGEEIFEQLT